MPVTDSTTREQVVPSQLEGKVKYSTIDALREFHDEEASTYWLPKDESEQKRLTGQHFALKELFGGSILKSVTDVLDLEKGVSVIDIGCGSGVWIMDMINDYPNCSYVGSDIVDVVNKNVQLQQFTFQQGNVVKGLPYEDNSFDLVHIRLLVYALRKEEWPLAIKEAIRITKPGGIFQITEGEPRLPKDPSSPYYRFTEAIYSSGFSRGQNPRVMAELETMLLETGSVKILESDERCSNTSANTPNSKKFAWDMVEALKSTINSVGPIIGINSKEESKKFIEDYKQCLATSENLICFKAVVAQKNEPVV
ncbi:S-adenosyl-L-methionine-dependent methyltransferase [Sporodiniella umbellata]|nr:S-adenosyl-L-methionine-dependent methyltransferase [Sporodiniella umbellata]